MAQIMVPNWQGPLTQYVTFPFHRVTSLFSKIFSCVIKQRCSHWQERLCHVLVLFRHRSWARMFDVTERVWTGLYLLDSDNVNSLTSPPPHCECLLAMSAACLSLEVDEKLIELVHKCEEVYDMSNKEYSDKSLERKTEYYRIALHCTLSFCQGTKPDGLLKICLYLSLNFKSLWDCFDRLQNFPYHLGLHLDLSDNYATYKSQNNVRILRQWL